jgi:hypothetical protein
MRKCLNDQLILVGLALAQRYDGWALARADDALDSNGMGRKPAEAVMVFGDLVSGLLMAD